MTSDRVAELEEQVAALRAELSLDQDRNDARVRRLMLQGLTPDMARVAGCMYRRDNSRITPELYDLIAPPTRDVVRAPNDLKVMICKLRKHLAPGSIQTLWGAGYQLTASGRASLATMLGEAA